MNYKLPEYHQGTPNQEPPAGWEKSLYFKNYWWSIAGAEKWKCMICGWESPEFTGSLCSDLAADFLQRYHPEHHPIIIGDQA